jgi:hypothetical protein
LNGRVLDSHDKVIPAVQIGRSEGVIRMAKDKANAIHVEDLPDAAFVDRIYNEIEQRWVDIRWVWDEDQPVPVDAQLADEPRDHDEIGAS